MKNLEAEFISYNRTLRRNSLPEMSMEQFIKHKSGRSRKRLKKKPFDYDRLGNHSFRDKIYDISDMKYTTSHPGVKLYSGSLIKGIAVSHKSNLIPISSQEQAEDVAKMRRN